MAKRKRLNPPDLGNLPGAASTPDVRSDPPGYSKTHRHRAPVADMVGAASAVAALEELSDDMRRARAEGRMVLRIPLDKIDAAYLVRDRILLDEEDLEVLQASMAARGQQMPLDVVELGGESYGLISGLRRLTALKRLREQTGEARFSEALCLVRQPADSPEAYLAMVEENEIRSGLSFYERAAIVSRAAGQGAFPDTRAALRGLFGAASKAKRSKIGSFVAIFEQLDVVLAHPVMIPERLGLALSQALESDKRFATTLAQALEAEPDRTALRERTLLEAAVRSVTQKGAAPKPAPAPTQAAPGVYLESKGSKVILSGPGVDGDLRAALAEWLANRSG